MTFRLEIVNLLTDANQINILTDPLRFAIPFRQCSIGESYNSDLSCKPCDEGYFNFQAPTEVKDCIKCAENARCYGGNKVVTSPGYWRESITSSVFLQCPNPEACIGGDTISYQGSCARGYTGKACADCDEGYVLDGIFQCTRCSGYGNSVLRVVIPILVGVAIVVLICWTFSSYADDVRSLLPVQLRIMSNHFQLLGALALMQFSWSSIK